MSSVVLVAETSSRYTFVESGRGRELNIRVTLLQLIGRVFSHQP